MSGIVSLYDPTMIRVLNTGGRAIADGVNRAFPTADVVQIKRNEPIASDLSGDVLLASFGSGDLIAQLAGRVTWVHVFGTGIDWLPPEAFEAKVVTCARGGSAIAISEFVLAAMLSFEKQLPELWDRTPDQVFGRADLGGLYGRHLGLVGLGGIATAIATRALAFGMSVSAVRRRRGPSPIAGVTTATRDEVFGSADHLVLAAPATPETHHLIGRDTTGHLKAGVHLVNIARGSLIDQDALRNALDDGRVARATLDVCDPEPLPEGHWLYTHPKVRLTGHISWSSPEGYGPLIQAFVDNLDRFVRDQPLAGVVDPTDRY
jgi:phosphoglycerate dehydrogenase-like enzyme